MRLIFRGLRALLAIVGLLATVAVAVVAVAAWWVVGRVGTPAALPDRMVLSADLRQPIEEAPGAGSVLPWRLRTRPSVSEVVLALDRAADDPRVAGLVALVDETEHGLAVAQELRDAVQRLRAGGRFALAFADSFGELAPANEGYYLATAFDEIWLQPAGVVGLTGLSIEQPFFGRLLERAGLELDVLRRAEYKTAFENVTEAGLTPPNREMLEAVLTSLNGQIADGIARGRKLEPARAATLLTGGPYSAADALRLSLIDGVGYRDELVERAVARAQGATMTPLERYVQAGAPPDRPVARVALVQAEGLVRRGGSGLGIDAEAIAATLDDAAEDGTIDAILLRVSSPGGSPAASETISHAVRRASRAGKPVIVSMGGVAASGGYWLALGADRIVAQPATLTGSIGVIGAKLVAAEALARLEIGWPVLVPEGGTPLWSPSRPFEPAERARLDALVGDLYRDFVQRVADSRDLPTERVELIARGRVWTGEAAEPLRLVDRLGGVHEALAEARSLLGLPEEAQLEVVTQPTWDWSLKALLDRTDWTLSTLAGVIEAVALIERPAATARMPAIGLR